MIGGLSLENSYAELPSDFFQAASAAGFPSPKLLLFNEPLACELGFDCEGLSEDSLARYFSGQAALPNSVPIAQAYAGHQFGGFTMLGDGRALLLGEQRSPAGQLYDLQLKGSGPTEFSRRGDGLAALGPMLREYIISESMHALGIPTTRSLAVVGTGELVYRETPLPGAVLTRVARSHLRVGTFQYAATRRDDAQLKTLADYAIHRHDPDLLEIEGADRYVGFLRSVMQRQAELIAKWQLVGFIHGVMNTDNVTISGETIDYGPCAFMDQFHKNTVFSSIDQGGRYGYGNQPGIGQWNLARFAETLLPLIHAEQDPAVEIATGVLNEYPEEFERLWRKGMGGKLGIARVDEGDRELFERLLDGMQANEDDFTNTFLALRESLDPNVDQVSANVTFLHSPDGKAWKTDWQKRLEHEATELSDQVGLMARSNPVVIPRNHRVEEALAAAHEGDFATLQALLDVLAKPFEYDESNRRFREAPAANTCYQTYCGT